MGLNFLTQVSLLKKKKKKFQFFVLLQGKTPCFQISCHIWHWHTLSVMPYLSFANAARDAHPTKHCCSPYPWHFHNWLPSKLLHGVGSLYPDTPFRTVRTIDECFKDFARLIGDTPKVVNKPISNDAIIVPNSKPEALVITVAWARLICYYIILNVFQALPMLLCDLLFLLLLWFTIFMVVH